MTSLLITTSDRARLGTLIDCPTEFGPINRRYLADLEQEIENAAYVNSSDVPGDVVTMNSTVRLRDLITGVTETYTIVYPKDVDIDQNRISILGPVATGTIGKRVGDIVVWPTPGGNSRLLIEELIFQPERSGAFDL